jgi:hypothetical protein
VVPLGLAMGMALGDTWACAGNVTGPGVGPRDGQGVGPGVGPGVCPGVGPGVWPGVGPGMAPGVGHGVGTASETGHRQSGVKMISGWTNTIRHENPKNFGSYKVRQ